MVRAPLVLPPRKVAPVCGAVVSRYLVLVQPSHYGVANTPNGLTRSRVDWRASWSMTVIILPSSTFSTASLTQEPDGTFAEEASIARPLIPDSAQPLEMARAVRAWWRSFPSYFALYLSEVGIDTLLDMIWVLLS